MDRDGRQLRATQRMFLVLALSALPGCGSRGGAPGPNIVLIVADDLGWSDVGYHGGTIETPNLDRLAREGVRLEHFYVNPLCSPTRAALMTGRYPIRFGLARSVIAPWSDFGLDPDEETLPQALSRGGYRHRALFGKWHLGHLRRCWLPLERGFTHFHGHLNGWIDYYTHERSGQPDWHLDDKPLTEEGYSTDLIADAAAKFIRRHSGEGPLFLVVSFNAVHAPETAPMSYVSRYDRLRGADGNPSLRQIRAAMITCMDDGIGRVLAALEQTGIAEQTLVWFLSDNGATVADVQANRPLRDGKLGLFEGGIRIPSVVRWPEAIPAGTVLESPTAVQDVLPTLLQASASSRPGARPLDGIGLLAALRGVEPPPQRELLFYCGYFGEESEMLAAIDWPWKLLVQGPSLMEGSVGPEHETLLFDLQSDPGESVDLAGEQPERVREWALRLAEFRRLEPARHVPLATEGMEGFTAPKDWEPVVPR